VKHKKSRAAKTNPLGPNTVNININLFKKHKLQLSKLATKSNMRLGEYIRNVLIHFAGQERRITKPAKLATELEYERRCIAEAMTINLPVKYKTAVVEQAACNGMNVTDYCRTVLLNAIKQKICIKTATRLIPTLGKKKR